MSDTDEFFKNLKNLSQYSQKKPESLPTGVIPGLDRWRDAYEYHRKLHSDPLEYVEPPRFWRIAPMKDPNKYLPKIS